LATEFWLVVIDVVEMSYGIANVFQLCMMFVGIVFSDLYSPILF